MRINSIDISSIVYPVTNNSQGVNIKYVISTLDDRLVKDEEIISIFRGLITHKYEELTPEDEDVFNKDYLNYPISGMIYFYDKVFVDLCSLVVKDEFVIREIVLDIRGTNVIINKRSLVLSKEYHDQLQGVGNEDEYEYR